MPARWMLYSYDALGLGHVRRTLAIARSVLARRSDLATLLTTCSPQIDALPVPPGLDYIKLPSARKIDRQQYTARTLPIESERLLALRSDILLGATRWLEPDLLMVDKSPDGLMGEMLPALDLLRRRASGARIVLGWRDILDAPRLVRAEWAERRTLAIIEQYYDEIWVYGDPAIFDVREAYELPDHLADRVRYLGYLAPAGDPTARDRVHQAMGIDGDRLALVTGGGGEDGEALLACYLESARLGYLPDGLRSMLVTGPFMHEETERRVRAAAPERVRVGRYVPGLEEAISAADVVVSLAGYNTVCEVLGAGTPAVLVPRMGHRSEQTLRAARLATLGLVEYVPPAALEPRALAAAIRRALDRGRGRPPAIRLDGLERVAAAVRRLLPAPAETVAAAAAGIDL